MEKLNYHVDFGPYYVHLTRKQKKYLAVRSVIDRILAALALILLAPITIGLGPDMVASHIPFQLVPKLQ